jgi:hypothetical protein
MAVYRLLCLFDGFLIVSAFNIDSIRKVAVVPDGVDAEIWHDALPTLRRERYRTLSHRRLEGKPRPVITPACA